MSDLHEQPAAVRACCTVHAVAYVVLWRMLYSANQSYAMVSINGTCRQRSLTRHSYRRGTAFSNIRLQYPKEAKHTFALYGETGVDLRWLLRCLQHCRPPPLA